MLDKKIGGKPKLVGFIVDVNSLWICFEPLNFVLIGVVVIVVLCSL